MSSSTLPKADARSDGTFYKMTLRTDRPIQSCELSPYPFLYLKGGALDNAQRQKKMESNPHKFTFRWFRGVRRQICQNKQCPRGSTFDPVYWSKTAIGGTSLRCATCEKAGVAGHLSLFCSSGCFKASYTDHCVTKHIPAHIKNSPLDRKDLLLRNGAFEEDLALLNTSKKVTTGDVRDISPVRATGTGHFNGTGDHNYVSIGGGANYSYDGAVQIVDEEEWEPTGVEKEYLPVAEDVGCVLKVEVSAIGADGRVLAGPLFSYTDPVLSAPRPPPKRHLISVSTAAPLSSTSTRFRVVSYNILAELYATKQAYPYCDSWALSWPYRRSMIQQELEEAQGDIICLQEVQSDHFEQHLLPFMQSLGYDGVFKQKSREAMGGYGKVDGCATFYRRSRFTMVESYSIDFNETAREAAAAQGLDDNECRRFMNRLSKDNIAQIFIFESSAARSQGQTPGGRQARQMSSICVVNTHLYSNHTRPDVKLWQCLALMREVEQIAVARDVAVIVCGDFNSEPESAVHEYMTQGCLEQHHPELEVTDDLFILPAVQDISHGLELASAMVSGTGAEPLYTNFTATFKGTLDYIWYTPGRLRVVAVSNIPDPNDIFEQCGEGLPSASYPSDHVMLYTDFSMSLTGSGSVTRPGAHRRHLLPANSNNSNSNNNSSNNNSNSNGNNRDKSKYTGSSTRNGNNGGNGR